MLKEAIASAIHLPFFCAALLSIFPACSLALSSSPQWRIVSGIATGLCHSISSLFSASIIHSCCLTRSCPVTYSVRSACWNILIVYSLDTFPRPLHIPVAATPIIYHSSQTPSTMPTATNGTAASPYPSHPLGPLTAQEISRASYLVKSCCPPGTSLQFKAITLQEPAKAQLLPYLAAERNGEEPAHIDRRAFVVYYIRGTVR